MPAEGGLFLAVMSYMLSCMVCMVQLSQQFRMDIQLLVSCSNISLFKKIDQDIQLAAKQIGTQRKDQA